MSISPDIPINIRTGIQFLAVARSHPKQGTPHTYVRWLII
jgi:hypothetical protein